MSNPTKRTCGPGSRRQMEFTSAELHSLIWGMEVRKMLGYPTDEKLLLRLHRGYFRMTGNAWMQKYKLTPQAAQGGSTNEKSRTEPPKTA